jgi:hypothetical protein
LYPVIDQRGVGGEVNPLRKRILRSVKVDIQWQRPGNEEKEVLLQRVA